MRRIIMASITAVVVIAVLAGTLIPILDDAQTVSDTYTNEGYFNLTKYDTTTDVNLSWDYTNPAKLTINTVEYDLPSLGLDYTVAMDGDWFIRTNGSTYCQYIDPYGPRVSGSVSGTTNLTVTASGGNVTITNGTTTVTSDYSFIYAMSEDGEYVMKEANEPAYIFKDTDLLILGRSTIGSNTNVGVSISGNIDDGFTVSEFTLLGATFSNIEVNGEDVANHEDVYKLTSITFDGTLSGTTSNLTYSYFIVPEEITDERDVHFTDGENAILGAIPAMIIVALLLAVVAMVLRSRMD